jgi:hypothetical protein
VAKLVTKFKFLKPGARQGRGGYAKYIATRDGVEKIDDSKRFAPTTWNQKQSINKILRDFPDTKEMLEYEDYLQKQTVESASEFISRAIEDNAAVALNARPMQTILSPALVLNGLALMDCLRMMV